MSNFNPLFVVTRLQLQSTSILQQLPQEEEINEILSDYATSTLPQTFFLQNMWRLKNLLIKSQSQ